MTTERIDYETLMAYVDGELSADEAERVRAHLEHDAGARAQVERLRAAAALARSALDADLARPVPPALRQAVEQAVERARQAGNDSARTPPAAASSSAAALSAAAPSAATPSAAAPSAAAPSAAAPSGAAPAAPSPGVPRAAPRRGWLAALGLDWQPRLAFAASAATIAAGVLGYLIGSTTPTAPGVAAGVLVVSADGFLELTRALNATPSGERRALPDGAEVELVASFRSGDGALCREFRLTRGADDAVLALACRDQRQWRVNFAVATAAGVGYVPAAAPTAALDAFVASIGGGAPLARDDETRALAGR
jgi:hypothetical protein